MKLLIISSNYPHAGHQFSGIFNQRSVSVLQVHCDRVEVLAPRPYAPRWLSLLPHVPRWKTYAAMAGYEMRDGIPIYRPAHLQIPRVGSAFWLDQGAFLGCRRIAHKMHRRMDFDAIVSFDLVAAGGLAWRLAYDLGIPASGWATGEDVRQLAGTALERVVLRALRRLDLVFYQSRELREVAAALLGISPDLMPHHKHVILPRGVPLPPALSRTETRNRVRSAWGITDDQILVLSIGRIVQDKGIVELLEAMSIASARDSRIACVIVGSKPGFDEQTAIQKRLEEMPGLGQRVKLLPACSPDQAWDYLCAADIFAFPSHKEGMPNSLLEAMIMEIPAIAFAIPPILEIKAGTEALLVVPPLNATRFGEAIIQLAASPTARARIGKIGRSQVMDRFMVDKNMSKALHHLSQVIAA